MQKKKFVSVLAAAALCVAALTACGESSSSSTSQATTAVDTTATTESTTAATESTTAAATESTAATTETTEATADAETKSVTTPAGDTLTVPTEIDAIISMAPSATRVLIDLGLSDEIVACDTYSYEYYGDQLTADLPTFDMMSPDNEQIIALNADIVFTTGMSSAGGEDVYATAKENGVCVADIATPSSLDELVDDVRFIGDCTGTDASSLISDFEDTESALQTAAEGVTEPKTVMVISATPTEEYPDIYAAGADTYIDDIVTLLGETNIATESGWVSYSEEAAVALNPDVIISSDTYSDAATYFASSDAWKDVTAVQNGAVYTLETANELNQPNNHTISAMVEMAKDIDPDAFADVQDPYQ